MDSRTLLFAFSALVAACGAAPQPVTPGAAEPAPPIGPIPDYDRRAWRHWIDADHDCQDTRQEVLIAESEVPVSFADKRRCRVTTGRWRCPYTGDVYTEPRQLDVDHMVPLKNAHCSGGWAWDGKKRERYANDLDQPEHLVVVAKGANRAKGSKGPEEWMPPDEDAWCGYVSDWIEIKGRWGLSMTAEERAKVNEVVDRCGQ